MKILKEVANPMLISAKDELEQYYGIHLKTEDKLIVLEAMMLELIDKDLLVTNRYERIPALAKKQVLDECFDILKKYYVVERAGEEE